ncbi:hypothetical protein PPTG_23887 [Phytophthora nicotianae INRA-310]|uniref:Uncharacterized protein n=1 Tax=Phytophthora nicotianae (strain INRA-310) TaxID=761204 RepID=W2PQ71_PHYN3|nr:hypothetical protein PPTG_23887 [Phytophthora nicotianae INRA-310]ETN02766.1 hypothetical protein PPTG_23887 [Phytophthora nicotianae INRA-310]
MMYGYLAKIYFPVFVCSLVGDIAAVHLTHHKVVYSIPIASLVVSVTLRRKPLHLFNRTLQHHRTVYPPRSCHGALLPRYSGMESSTIPVIPMQVTL